MGRGRVTLRGADRGQSEVIGTMLITVIFALLIGTIAIVIIFPMAVGETVPPATEITADAVPGEVTVTHEGGESLRTDQLRLIIRKEGATERAAFESVVAGSQFEEGDVATFNPSTTLVAGDEIQVLVVHQGTNHVIYDGRQTVVTRSGVSGTRLVWSAAGDWDAGSSERVVHDAVGDRSPTRLQIGYKATGVPGLVSYYPLDEDTGINVEDATGLNDGTLKDDSLNNHDAYDQGVPGVFGRSAYEFTPQKTGLPTSFEKGAYIDLGSGTAQELAGSAFTWMAWVKVDEVGGGKESIVSVNHDDRTNNLLWFLCKENPCVAGNDAQDPAYMTIHDGSFHVDSDGPQVNDDRWHHVAITADSSGLLTYYVDGTATHTYDTSHQIESDDIMSLAQDSDDENYGFGTGTSDFLEGRLDEVRIYDEELPQSEIQLNRRLEGTYTSGTKSYDRPVPADDVELRSVSADPGDGKITVDVGADTDGDGTIDAWSDPIVLDAATSTYQVDFSGGVTAATYQLEVTLESGRPADPEDPEPGPVVDRIDIKRP